MFRIFDVIQIVDDYYGMLFYCHCEEQRDEAMVTSVPDSTMNENPINRGSD
jgi:hypothetical protein